ncbi:hypothetical protein MMC14_000818 [Varicellaria rhodocarpa]|nr:hypothetical protein [Varicellaria rhodocarpa]
MVEKCLLAAHEAGHAFNKDHNDGDPEGISVAQFNVDNGVRTTSSTAFLNEQARSSIQNLRTITRTICAKVIFEGRTAIGVELEPAKPDGTDKKTTVYANKEVILSAGCFESPHILLLSGVGSSNHLASLGIPLIHDLPAVGQNLRDHSTLTCEFIIDPSIAGHNQLLNDPAAMNTALEEYNEYKTGPLVVFGASAAVVFSRLPQLFATKEFSDLSENSRSFLMNENRPGTEIWMHSGPQYYTGPCPPDASVLVLEGLCQNNISHGSVTLSSKDARVPPLIDPSYLSEPYDFRIAIETLKEMIKISNTPTFSSLIRSILHGPRSPLNYDSLASPSDEVVLKNFIRDTLQQGYHGMGTCMMGKLGDANRVVGSDFKVIDVEGLRVADMSICPILTTNHTQVNAYLIGERCADLVIQESKEQPKYLKM